MDQASGLGVRENATVIHDTIRGEILEGRRAPGSAISQLKIAQSLGVSRGPVREALRMLQREGLVDAEINQRARVASFSIEDLEGLYALRIVNEALGIRTSVPLFSGAEVKRLHNLLEQMDNERQAGSIERWEVPHKQFHRLLISHAGSRIVGSLTQLADHAGRYRHLYITGAPRAWSVGEAEHREIVIACEQRDEALAASLLGRHFASTALAVLAMRVPEHEPRQVRTALQLVLDHDRQG